MLTDDDRCLQMSVVALFTKQLKLILNLHYRHGKFILFKTFISIFYKFELCTHSAFRHYEQTTVITSEHSLCRCLSLWFCLSSQFTSLSVTSGVDQMVALHTTSQDDVLLCLQRGELCPNQDRVGELVGSLVDCFTRSVLQLKHCFLTRQTPLVFSCCFLL